MSIGKKGSLARRVAAAVGALAVGVMGLAGAALTANATDTGNIIVPPNAGSETTLTIHKYSGVQGDAGDGTEQTIDPDTHEPLVGVTFKIQKVVSKNGQTINLDTPEGWDLIKGVQADDVTKDGTPYALADVPSLTDSSVTTDSTGTASTPLPHGLYYVTETDFGSNPIVAGTAPFLVTMPLPKVAADNSTNGTWIYNVHVYPKNQVMNAPEKTINSDADQSSNGQLKIGDTVTYTIKQTVPALNKEDTEYKSASIWDTLPDGLEFVSGSSTVTKTGTAFADGDVATNESGVTWKVQPDGLKKLAEGDVITVTFKTKVTTLTSTGEIANPGSGQPGTPGYGSEFNSTHVPGTTTPYTYWGQLKVTKVVQGNTSQKLKDAEFTVGKTVNGACPASAPADTDTATFVAKGTSNADGIVQWEVNDPETAQPAPNGLLGLFVANSDTDLGNNVDPKDYCLYETKAPAGYILVKDVKTVKIHAGTANLVTGDNDITVDNQQQDHPNLPLTGAAGTVVMTLGGIALVAAGGAAYAISRKRSAR
jgi:fimbrial isopeptide formation D2 family protein/LPXTG-motif cell wall-anchored protein